MKKAKIYMPTKNVMQASLTRTNKWIIEFYTKDSGIEPLMGWESSTDTLNELKLEFSTKELAVEYANKNKIEFEIIVPKERKIIKKSYSDNFTK
jgi:NADH dehydrogenase (ubiquinone) Fe-S protein 4